MNDTSVQDLRYEYCSGCEQRSCTRADDIAGEVLSCFDENGKPAEDEINALRLKYGEDHVTEALSELEALKSEGLLFSSDPYEDTFSADTSPPVVKALCLHMAHDCNLRCKYCFAGKEPITAPSPKMPAEVAKRQ